MWPPLPCRVWEGAQEPPEGPSYGTVMGTLKVRVSLGPFSGVIGEHEPLLEFVSGHT